jgi:PleD family two-component response regulator
MRPAIDCFVGFPGVGRPAWRLLLGQQNKSKELTMQIGVEISRVLENKRIFVVDSDEVSRAALQFMLHDENETHELADLHEAYAKAETGRPDLVLLGSAVIAASGVGVLAQLAEHFSGIRILLIAGPDDDDLISKSLKAGAHGVLRKPLRIEMVRDKVDIVLGRKAPVIVPLTVLTSRP